MPNNVEEHARLKAQKEQDNKKSKVILNQYKSIADKSLTRDKIFFNACYFTACLIKFGVRKKLYQHIIGLIKFGIKQQNQLPFIRQVLISIAIIAIIENSMTMIINNVLDKLNDIEVYQEVKKKFKQGELITQEQVAQEIRKARDTFGVEKYFMQFFAGFIANMGVSYMPYIFSIGKSGGGIDALVDVFFSRFSEFFQQALIRSAIGFGSMVVASVTNIIKSMLMSHIDAEKEIKSKLDDFQKKYSVFADNLGIGKEVEDFLNLRHKEVTTYYSGNMFGPIISYVLAYVSEFTGLAFDLFSSYFYAVHFGDDLIDMLAANGKHIQPVDFKTGEANMWANYLYDWMDIYKTKEENNGKDPDYVDQMKLGTVLLVVADSGKGKSTLLKKLSGRPTDSTLFSEVKIKEGTKPNLLDAFMINNFQSILQISHTNVFDKEKKKDNDQRKKHIDQREILNHTLQDLNSRFLSFIKQDNQYISETLKKLINNQTIRETINKDIELIKEKENEIAILKGEEEIDSSYLWKDISTSKFKTIKQNKEDINAFLALCPKLMNLNIKSISNEDNHKLKQEIEKKVNTEAYKRIYNLFPKLFKNNQESYHEDNKEYTISEAYDSLLTEKEQLQSKLDVFEDEKKGLENKVIVAITNELYFKENDEMTRKLRIVKKIINKINQIDPKTNNYISTLISTKYKQIGSFDKDTLKDIAVDLLMQNEIRELNDILLGVLNTQSQNNNNQENIKDKNDLALSLLKLPESDKEKPIDIQKIIRTLHSRGNEFLITTLKALLSSYNLDKNAVQRLDIITTKILTKEILNQIDHSQLNGFSGLWMENLIQEKIVNDIKSNIDQYKLKAAIEKAINRTELSIDENKQEIEDFEKHKAKKEKKTAEQKNESKKRENELKEEKKTINERCNTLKTLLNPLKTEIYQKAVIIEDLMKLMSTNNRSIESIMEEFLRNPQILNSQEEQSVNLEILAKEVLNQFTVSDLQGLSDKLHKDQNMTSQLIAKYLANCADGIKVAAINEVYQKAINIENLKTYYSDSLKSLIIELLKDYKLNEEQQLNLRILTEDVLNQFNSVILKELSNKLSEDISEKTRKSLVSYLKEHLDKSKLQSIITKSINKKQSVSEENEEIATQYQEIKECISQIMLAESEIEREDIQINEIADRVYASVDKLSEKQDNGSQIAFEESKITLSGLKTKITTKQKDIKKLKSIIKELNEKKDIDNEKKNQLRKLKEEYIDKAAVEEYILDKIFTEKYVLKELKEKNIEKKEDKKEYARKMLKELKECKSKSLDTLLKERYIYKELKDQKITDKREIKKYTESRLKSLIQCKKSVNEVLQERYIDKELKDKKIKKSEQQQYIDSKLIELNESYDIKIRAEIAEIKDVAAEITKIEKLNREIAEIQADIAAGQKSASMQEYIKEAEGVMLARQKRNLEIAYEILDGIKVLDIAGTDITEFAEIQNLSEGQFFRVTLALSIMQGNDIYIDEKISNLDKELKRKVLRYLVEYAELNNRLVLIIDHNLMNNAEVLDALLEPHNTEHNMKAEGKLEFNEKVKEKNNNVKIGDKIGYVDIGRNVRVAQPHEENMKRELEREHFNKNKQQAGLAY